MITLEEVLFIHNEIVLSSGCPTKVRDMNSLESAIARPFQTFDGIELYNTTFEKAAAIAESIIFNHPFVKGNKRTAFKAMELLLIRNNLLFQIHDDESFKRRNDFATHELSYAEIVIWIKEISVPIINKV